MKKYLYVIFILFMFLLVGCNKKTVVISFNTNLGSYVDNIYIESDETITINDTSHKEGYIFSGWFIDKECTEEINDVNQFKSNIVLYAKWIPETFTITFESNGGSEVEPITESFMSPIEEPIPPEKQEHIFLGWFLDPELTQHFNFNLMPLGGAKLYAKWEANFHEVMFIDYNGHIISQQLIAHGSNATLPEEPTRQGYTFRHWDTSHINIVTNTSIKAIYDINQYTIAFNSNGGSEVEDIKQDYMSDIEEPLPPTKQGYVFSGWFVDVEMTRCFEFSIMPLDGVTLHAKWKNAMNFYLKNDGTYEIDNYIGFDEEVFIPSQYNNIDVTSICKYTFYNNNYIKTIHIPNTIESIGMGAFANCTNLQEIIIPNSVTKIDRNIFSGCLNLKTLSLPFIGSSLDAIEEESFLGYIFSTDPISGGNEIIVNYHKLGLEKKYYIPTNFTTLMITNSDIIKYAAIKGWNTIEEITLNNQISKIEDEAFAFCTYLKTINLSENIEEIGEKAFYHCENLSSIKIPNSTVKILDYAFKNCFKLENIEFDDQSSLEEIGKAAFFMCTNLKKIRIPDSTIELGEDAFANCIKLKHIYIPDNILVLNTRLFFSCESLEIVYIPEGVNIIDKQVFEDCFKLSTIFIPNSIASIKEDVFKNCSSLDIVNYNDTQEQWSNIVGGGIDIITNNIDININYNFADYSEFRDIYYPE